MSVVSESLKEDMANLSLEGNACPDASTCMLARVSQTVVEETAAAA